MVADLIKIRTQHRLDLVKPDCLRSVQMVVYSSMMGDTILKKYSVVTLYFLNPRKK